MASYAKASGLQFKAGALSDAPLALDATASLHRSRTGAYCIFPPNIRNILPDSSLAGSVNVRCANPDPSYAPENLHFVAGQLANTYSLADVGSIVI